MIQNVMTAADYISQRNSADGYPSWRMGLKWPSRCVAVDFAALRNISADFVVHVALHNARRRNRETGYIAERPLTQILGGGFPEHRTSQRVSESGRSTERPPSSYVRAGSAPPAAGFFR